MIISAEKGFQSAVFIWNDELTECHHRSIGVTDEDFALLIEAKVYEGCDLEGWTVNII